MTAESLNHQCLDNESYNKEWSELTEKQKFIDNMLNKWVEIETEDQFNQIINILKKEWKIDLTPIKFWKINSWYSFAIKHVQGNSKLSVFTLQSSMDMNSEWPFWRKWFLTSQGFELDLSRDVTYMKSQDNKFQRLLEGYNNAQGQVVWVSQQNLCDLQSDVQENSDVPPFSPSLHWRMNSSFYHEDAYLWSMHNGVDTSEWSDTQWVSDEIVNNQWMNQWIVANSTWGENEEDELLGNTDDLVEDSDEQNLKEEEAITEKSHIVIQGDRIWKILQNEEFGYTERQTNLLIEELKKNATFLSTLKSKDVDKIYPGETITFPAEILNSVHLSDDNEEVILDENLYEVQNGDTPGKIIFDNYQGANWGNIKEIMKALEIWNVIKSGQKIDLKETIILEDGKTISKKTES